MPKTPHEAAALHSGLVDRLVREGRIGSPQVEAAFRAVPRHLFLPQVPHETAYSDAAIPTKLCDGQAISSSSQPSIMAIMLEQLDLRPGQRVLEIGAGTGYNAALLAHIVGEEGQVVTIDIDEDTVAAAREHLAATGYARVQVLCADGSLGHADLAPYDRIIATVRAHDLPTAWWEQLRPGGRLVVPMGFTPLETATGALNTLVAFERRDDHLESRLLAPCGFMALRGALGITPAEPIALGATPRISLLAERAVEPDRIAAALTGTYSERAGGVAVAPWEVFGLRLWLWLHDPRFCDLWVQGEAVATGVVPFLLGTPGTLEATVGLCAGPSIALLAHPEEPGPTREGASDAQGLVVRAFGPDAGLAEQLIEHLRAWERAGRPFAYNLRGLIEGPRLRVYPREPAYVPGVDEVVVARRTAQLVFGWRRDKEQSASATLGAG